MSPLPTFEAVAGWPVVRDRLAGLPASTLARLDEAVTFATDRHAGQTRPAGEPYLEHLLETVQVLAVGVGVTDPDLLVAGVLHDVVEDTRTTLAEVTLRFGARVAELVDWVTKPPPSADRSPAADRAAYLTRLRSAPADAVTVKLADRLSNVQRLETHPRPAKRTGYYRETVAAVLPLAEGQPWLRAWFARWQAANAHLDRDAAP